MIINGVNVQKIIEPQQLGVWNDKIIYICFGKFGYLRYDKKLLNSIMGTKRKFK